jgi:hypothetical protein
MGFQIDAAWVGALASVAAAVIAIITSLRARKNKSLAYEILSESPLVSISDEVKGSLQVLFNGKPVENLHLLLIKFVNDGNVPIARDDFERCFTLLLKDGSDIISVEAVQTTPDNLAPSINVGGQVITVDPIMLNPGDAFTIKILVSKYSGEADKVAVDARVLGIRSIQTPSQNDGKIKAGMTAGIVASLLALTFIGWAVFGQLSATRKLLSSEPPHIDSISPQGILLRPGSGTILTAFISNNTPGMKYQWSAVRGKTERAWDDSAARYTAPEVTGRDLVTLTVTDDMGHSATKSIAITITEDAPTWYQSGQGP